MNGKMMMVEPVTVFLPDVQGRMAVEKVTTILRHGRSELITAADNYIHNEHVGGLSSGNVAVGVEPAMISATNGVGALENDHSDPAILIKETVAHMKKLVDPVVEKFDAIAKTRVVSGPSDEVQASIENRLQALLAEKDVEMARLIATEIENIITTEASQIRGDAGMMEGESSRVDIGLGEEKEEFDRRSRGLGESYAIYKGSIGWQRTALHSVADAAERKGGPLRQKCHQVMEEVSGVEAVWQQFTAQLFKEGAN